MVALFGFPGLRDTTARFRQRLVAGAGAYGGDVGDNANMVAAVVSFESRFDPRAVNPHSGAVGLIQWTKSGAAAIGKTQPEIAAMSDLQQLDLALEWFGARGAPFGRAVDWYLSVFFPEAIGKPPGFVIAESPQLAYEQNKGMDVNGDKILTVADVASRFGSFVAAAEAQPRVIVHAGGGARQVIAGLLIAAAAAGGAYAWWRRL